MPLILPPSFPAVKRLLAEGLSPTCFIESGQDAPQPQLRIAVLNLMPLKEDTETDLVRVFSNTPLCVELCWTKLATHTPKHAAPTHMEAFYRTLDEWLEKPVDGLIVTGAPVEHLPFEAVTYWEELTAIFDRAATLFRSSLYICWAAQAALYHYHGIEKYPLGHKMFGIFAHQLLCPQHPLLNGFDAPFAVPHSRHTGISLPTDLAETGLSLLASSDEAGPCILSSGAHKAYYITGHLEYAPDTLGNEYRRDVERGLPISLPRHYYPANDASQPPLVSWRAHARLFYQNWLHLLLTKPSSAA